MKLSEYAKKNNITYKTAWKHFKLGKIPNSRQLETGTVVIDEDEDNYKNILEELKKINVILGKISEKLSC
jgi:hypothetical protein